jgi:hypothetical protein
MWLSLLVVALPPVGSSARNLYALGHEQLALPGRWALLVPLSVDAAALLCVVLTLRALYAAQSAGLARLLVAVFAAFSAWLGYQEAATIGTTAAVVFYPAMPVAAALLLDMVLRHRRRDVLDDLGALEPPLPRYRALRWLIAPRETWRAWSVGVRHGITDPAVCLAFVRETAALRVLSGVDAVRYAHHASGSHDPFTARAWLAARGCVVDQAALDAASDGLPPAPRAAAPATPPAGLPVVAIPSGPDLGSMTKRDAIRSAFHALGSRDPGRAVTWLADRGVTVERREAQRVAREDTRRRTRPALAAVPGGAS